MNIPRRWEAFAVLAAGAAATSWAAIFVRLADEAPPLTIAAYRLLIASAAMGLIAFAIARRRHTGLPPRDSWHWLALSGALLAGHFWAWFASLERTSVGSSVVIVAMQPLIAGFLGAIFLKERTTRAEWIGIAVAAVGFAIIGGRDFAEDPGSLTGDLLAFLAALFIAGNRLLARYLRDDVSTWTYSASSYAMAAVVLWSLVALLRPQVTGFEGDTWLYMVLLALIPQVIGHTAFNWAMTRLRVVTVSMVTMFEPIGATLIAIPVLDERPGWGLIAGGPLILAGIAIGLRYGRGERDER